MGSMAEAAVSANTGGLMMSGSAMNEAIEAGDPDYGKAGAINYPIGALEGVLGSRLFGRLQKATQGSGVGKRIGRAVTSSLEEGTGEYIQGLASNLTAQQLYDETREVFTPETLREGLAGAVVGGGLSVSVETASAFNQWAQKIGTLDSDEAQEYAQALNDIGRQMMPQQSEQDVFEGKDVDLGVGPELPDGGVDPYTMDDAEAMRGKVVEYEGEEGYVDIDEGGKVTFTSVDGSKIVEIGGQDDLSQLDRIAEVTVENVLNDDGSITLGKETFVPNFDTAEITTDEQGGVYSVELETDKGPKTLYGDLAALAVYENQLRSIESDPEVYAAVNAEMTTNEEVIKTIEYERAKEKRRVAAAKRGNSKSAKRPVTEGKTEDTSDGNEKPWSEEELNELNELIEQEEIDNIEQTMDDFFETNKKHFRLGGRGERVLKSNAPKKVKAAWADMRDTLTYKSLLEAEQAEKESEQGAEPIPEPEERESYTPSGDDLIDYEDDPEKLLNEYEIEYNNPTSASAMDVAISEALGSVNRESFIRFSDRSNIGLSLARTYLKKGARGIDQVAQDATAALSGDDNTLNETVTPDDVVAHMLKYPNRMNLQRQNDNARLRAISDRYAYLTGKPIYNIRSARAAQKKLDKMKAEEKSKALEPTEAIEEALQLLGGRFDMDQVINDKEFFTAFPGSMTDEQYETFRQAWADTSPEEQSRLLEEVSQDDGPFGFGDDPFAEESTSTEIPEQQPEVEAEAGVEQEEWRQKVSPKSLSEIDLSEGQGDTRDQLVADVKRAVKARDRVNADINERGMALFDESEGSLQESIFSERDTSKENVDKIRENADSEIYSAVMALEAYDRSAFYEDPGQTSIESRIPGRKAKPKSKKTGKKPAKKSTKAKNTPPPPKHPWSNYGGAQSDGRVEFSIPALVQFLRKFNQFPVVNKWLKGAKGRLNLKAKRVELLEMLTYNPVEAQQTLAHEIGHFVDLLIESGGDLLEDFSEKLAKGMKANVVDQIGEGILNEEAIKLSKRMRPGFVDGDSYYESGIELFADFMSAIMTDPEMVRQDFPLLYDMFENLFETKPMFKEAYGQITEAISGDWMVDEMGEQIGNAAVESMSMASQKVEKEKLTTRLKNNWRTFWAKLGYEPLIHYRQRFSKNVRNSFGFLSDMENAHTWASSENLKLFQGTGKGDSYYELVKEHLDKVSVNAKEAISLLQRFAVAKRVVDEDRGAAQFLRQNPEVAKEVLMFFAELDSRFATAIGDIESMLDADYEDAMARAISALRQATTDMSKSKRETTFERVGRKIDSIIAPLISDAASGRQILGAFNVRGRLLNPSGHTPETAKKELDKLKAEIGDSRFESLEKASKGLSNWTYNVQKMANKEGLISDSVFQNVVEPNKDNYVPFAVMEYYEGKMGAGMKEQAGTAKDIVSVILTSQQLVTAINFRRQTQRAVQMMMDLLSSQNDTSQDFDISEKPMTFGEILQAQRTKDKTSRLPYYIDGNLHMVEFYKDPSKSLEKMWFHAPMDEFMDSVTRALTNINLAVLSTYTTLSPSFLFYRNMVREFRTQGNLLGYRKVLKFMTNPKHMREVLTLSKEYAFSITSGKPMSKEMTRLIDMGYLPAPMNTFWLADKPEYAAEQIVAGIISAHFNKTGKTMRKKVAEGLVNIFLMTDIAAKANAALIAEKSGRTPKEIRVISRALGIPNPSVTSADPAIRKFLSSFYGFARVAVQGTRVNARMAQDKKMWWPLAKRFGTLEILPSWVMASVGAGFALDFLRGTFGDDDDPEAEDRFQRSVAGRLGEFYRRVSPYKSAIDNLIPLAFYDPESRQYHWMFEYEGRADEIPVHWEAVSWRIPRSEQGRALGPLTHYGTTYDNPEMRAKEIDDIGDVLVQTVKSNVFSIAPPLEIGSNLLQVASGNNPDDAFTGYPIINGDLFDADENFSRAQGALGYTLGELGQVGNGVGTLMVWAGMLDPRSMQTYHRNQDKSKLGKLELVNVLNMFAHDNYDLNRPRYIEEAASKRDKARVDMMLPNDVLRMKDYYLSKRKRASVNNKMDDLRYSYPDQFETTENGFVKPKKDADPEIKKEWSKLMKSSPLSPKQKAQYEVAKEWYQSFWKSGREDLNDMLLQSRGLNSLSVNERRKKSLGKTLGQMLMEDSDIGLEEMAGAVLPHKGQKPSQQLRETFIDRVKTYSGAHVEMFNNVESYRLYWGEEWTPQTEKEAEKTIELIDGLYEELMGDSTNVPR